MECFDIYCRLCVVTPTSKSIYKNESHISIPFLGRKLIYSCTTFFFLFFFFFLQCSLISTFRLSSLTQYPVTCIFFSSLDYRTVICLRLVVVGNDLAENFPREPLDGRCLHKSSREIIVTCCLAPMLEEQRYPWKFSHPPVFTFIRSLTRSF